MKNNKNALILSFLLLASSPKQTYLSPPSFILQNCDMAIGGLKGSDTNFLYAWTTKFDMLVDHMVKINLEYIVAV